MKPVPFVDFMLTVLNVKLTLAQQVLWRVGIDGVDPVDLHDDQREIARILFGDVERIPADARGTLALLKGARVGGTWVASCCLLWSALTVPLTTLAAGEMAFAVCVAPTLKLASQSLRYAQGAAKADRRIARCIQAEDADGFTLRRHDGKDVRVEAVAASRGGAGLRGRSMTGCLLDEASFFRDADSGVVNDLELYRAVSPRIVPGGKLMVISTAWMRSGLLHESTEKNFGKPTTCISAIAPTQVLRPNDPQLERIIAEERSRDAANAAREFDCVPFDGAASSFIDALAIDAMVDDSLPIGGTP